MKFIDIPGHDQLKQKVTSLIADSKLPHAIMLAGNEGVGVLPMALAMAQMATCERVSSPPDSGASLFGDAPVEKTPMTDSCGVCPSCLKAQKFIHPDIHFVYPVYTRKPLEKTISSHFITEWRSAIAANPYLNLNDWLQHIGAENKQGNISATECREIIHSVSLKSFESRYKVYIIWMAELLKESGNILLKVIEEPPPNTLFIFAVEQIEKVIGTILSRTQLYKLPPISPQAIANYLIDMHEVPSDEANRIGKVSDGNLNLALEMIKLETGKYEEMMQRWFSICVRLRGALAKEASINLQNLSEEFQKLGRENQKAFFQYTIWVLREMTLVAQGIETEKLSESEKIFAVKVAKLLTGDRSLKLFQLFENAIYHIERNANPKILIYDVSFALSRVFVE